MKKLTQATPVLCPRLQTIHISKTNAGITQKHVHALVQYFDDASTRVLCHQMEEGKCVADGETNGVCPYQVEAMEQ